MFPYSSNKAWKVPANMPGHQHPSFKMLRSYSCLRKFTFPLTRRNKSKCLLTSCLPEEPYQCQSLRREDLSAVLQPSYQPWVLSFDFCQSDMQGSVLFWLIFIRLWRIFMILAHCFLLWITIAWTLPANRALFTI